MPQLRLFLCLALVFSTLVSVINAAECTSAQIAELSTLSSNVTAVCGSDALTSTSTAYCADSTCLALLTSMVSSVPSCEVQSYNLRTVVTTAIKSCNAASDAVPASKSSALGDFQWTASLILLQVAFETSGQCWNLKDSDSPLMKSLATAYRDDFSDFPFAIVFSDLHDAVPWLSTCVADIDPVAVYASMLTSSNFRSCLRKIDQTSLENGLWSSEGWEELCPLLQDTAIPCVKTVMVEIVMDAISATGGCCDPFLSQVETLFSDSLTTTVEKFAKYAVNIVCSKRKFTNVDGQATTVLCGYSIYNSLSFIESEDDIVPLLGLLQLPTSEMCDAFAGKSFMLTNGSEFTIGFGTKGSTTMGSCLEPINTFLNLVASWPIFAQTWSANGSSFTPSDVFASGKSLSFSIVKKWFNTPTNFPATVQRTLENSVIAVREVVTPRYSAHYYVDEKLHISLQLQQ